MTIQSKITWLLFVLVGPTLIGLTGCSPTTAPRQVHEGPREWKPVSAPNEEEVSASEFNALDVAKAYQTVTNQRADLLNEVLVPLSKIILNSQFIEVPRYRTDRLYQMLNVFNQAFLIELRKNNETPAFLALKKRYYDTVFSGCTGDLRNDCVNADLFNQDGRHTRIMTILASELDKEIDVELKALGSPHLCVEKSEKCRSLLEERYRRLAMGLLKRNRNADPEFAFAYLKYARAFAQLILHDKQRAESQVGAEELQMSAGYISDLHGKIFETLIAKYQPKSLSDPEFRAFVENFNPWVYSQKKADTFQHGTRIMFEFGAKCCLYKDGKKGPNGRMELSDSVKLAIAESQKDSDGFGLSFQQMIADIRKEFGNRVFENLGMAETLKDLSNPNSNFYNEYFLVVDRLFREHLTSSDVEMILNNTPIEITQSELPKTIATYIRVYLIHMVVETNRFMAQIYNDKIASDKIFEDAIMRSRQLTARWHSIQAQIDLLDRLMGSYFKGHTLVSSEFFETARLIKSVNRNIHYLSVYPNMAVMTYSLSKMKGKITVHTWWGQDVDIDSDVILDAFFGGGVSSPWFRFGKDPIAMDRQMLLYSWEYMLSTGAIDSFSTNEAASKQADRSKFFDLIFSKYVDQSIFSLRSQIDDFERNSKGSPFHGTLSAVCDFELGKRSVAPPQVIGFSDLQRYTYTGLGNNGANRLMSAILEGPGKAFLVLRMDIESHLNYLKTMVDIVEQDLIRSGQTKNRGEKHPDTATAYEMIRQIEALRLRLAKTYFDGHQDYFDCALRLQEVERRRANRLYDLEREHLGQVFDMMKPLVDIKDPAELAKRVDAINADYFRKSDNGFRFDSINGLSYRMSKYDLLMRMKNRIEKDVFSTPTDEERRIYGETDLAEYHRSRPVRVIMPDGIERDEMVEKQTATTLFVSGSSEKDRQAFINQGIAVMNGKFGSYIEWSAQRIGDTSLVKYLDTLSEAYFAGTVTSEDGRSYGVSPEELASSYVRVMASFTLDEFDQKNALAFGTDGRFDRRFFYGKFFEDNGSRLPFFYSLMESSKKAAGIDTEYGDPVSPAREAMDFAETILNLRQFVFEPSDQIPKSVKQYYGARVRTAFKRLGDLYEHLAKLEEVHKDPKTLDPRLANPMFLEGSQPVLWYSPIARLIDDQRRKDHQFALDDFRRRTNSFYEDGK